MSESTAKQAANMIFDKAQAKIDAQSARIAELTAALDAEQKAHDTIAGLCFMNGVETCDGTSVGAVQGLVDAFKEASAHEAQLERALDAARGALEKIATLTIEWDSNKLGPIDMQRKRWLWLGDIARRTLARRSPQAEEEKS